MKSVTITIFSLLISSSVFAQLTIGGSTALSTAGDTQIVISTDGNISLGSKEHTFGQLSLSLEGDNQQVVNSANSPVVFHQLFIGGGSIKTLVGDFEVSTALELSNGILYISDQSALVLSAPGVVLDGHSADSYVEGGLLVNVGESNNATFPIGSEGIYTPVTLENIAGADLVLGVDANKESIGTIAEKPDQVSVYSTNWNWEVFLSSGEFSAANIMIPLTDLDKDQFGDEKYKPVVLYKDQDGTTRNLDNVSADGASNTDPMITSKELAGVGHYFAGKTSATAPVVVHNLITPNGDNVNDYLVIDNLNFFPDNEIMIVDRYGVAVYSKVNYLSPTSTSAEGEDFSFLSPGNYICILKFDNGETIKQTVSVIK